MVIANNYFCVSMSVVICKYVWLIILLKTSSMAKFEPSVRKANPRLKWSGT